MALPPKHTAKSVRHSGRFPVLVGCVDTLSYQEIVNVILPSYTWMTNSPCTRLVACGIELRVPAHYSMAPSAKILLRNALGPSPFAAMYFLQPLFDLDSLHVCFDLVSRALNPVVNSRYRLMLE